MILHIVIAIVSYLMKVCEPSFIGETNVGDLELTLQALVPAMRILTEIVQGS